MTTQTDKKEDGIGEVMLTRMPTLIKDKDIQPEWMETFSEARASIAIASPLMAHLMFQCVYFWSPDLPTAGAMPVNGKNMIFINPVFWMNRLENNEQRAFVLLHEILHIFQEHSGRQMESGYNPELWNIATDYNINLFCSGTYKTENDGVSHDERFRLYVERPEFVLYQERFVGMSSDEIYHLLLEENDGDAQKACEAHGGGQRPDDGEGQAGQQGKDKPSKGQGSAGGAPAGQMPMDSVSGREQSDGEKGMNRQEAAAAVANASATKSIGEHEGDMVRSFQDLAKPRVNWKDELNENIVASTKERPTYNRLSRRTGEGGVVFPSLTGSKIELVWGVDTSGSMSERELKEAAAELKGILDQFESWTVHLVTCDTSYHVIGIYNSEDGDDFSNVSLDWIGGGGTDMAPLAEYAGEKLDDGEPINALIIFTDGYIPHQSLESALPMECRNLLVITSEGASDIELEDCKTIYMRDVG